MRWLLKRLRGGPPVPPDADLKAREELSYWQGRHSHEGTLANDHFERYYTTHFGLHRDYYRGKRVLDIGCGPRGILDWADLAAERIGLEHLAESYRALGTSVH